LNDLQGECDDQSPAFSLWLLGRSSVPELPDVPAISMFPGFSSTAWLAMVGPPKMQRTLAEKISLTVAEALRAPDVAQRFRDLSFKPVGTSPAETAAFLKQETERWRNVIVAGGIKPR
jgi:tripartite-type tricarboxylate transporter receptor subunit TctC